MVGPTRGCSSHLGKNHTAGGVDDFPPMKKKSNLICYHAVRESVAMGESLTAHIGTNENVGNLATKVLYGKKWRYMVSQLLMVIYGDH